MKGLVATTGCIAVIAGILAMPGSAAADNAKIARAECQNERQFDRADFIRDYGRGKLAMKRCVRRELRQARRECRLEKRRQPGDFKVDYGSGRKAMSRCVRHELI